MRLLISPSDDNEVPDERGPSHIRVVHRPLTWVKLFISSMRKGIERTAGSAFRGSKEQGKAYDRSRATLVEHTK
jgi:hypothetical protein